MATTDASTAVVSAVTTAVLSLFYFCSADVETTAPASVDAATARKASKRKAPLGAFFLLFLLRFLF